jgi:hypothetical protein
MVKDGRIAIRYPKEDLDGFVTKEELFNTYADAEKFLQDRMRDNLQLLVELGYVDIQHHVGSKKAKR